MLDWILLLLLCLLQHDRISEGLEIVEPLHCWSGDYRCKLLCTKRGGVVLTGCVNCYIKLLIKSGKIHYSCKNRQIIFAVLLLTFFCLKIKNI